MDKIFDPSKIMFAARRRYRATFNTPEGKQVLLDLSRFAGTHTQAHVPGDPYSTAFNDGKRRVVQRITSFLGMTDEEIIRLTKSEEAENYG